MALVWTTISCDWRILVFRVPQTYDVISSIFDPAKPKSFLDVLLLVILALQVIVFLLLPASIRRATSLIVFLCWRTAYDLGLGYILHEQSVRRALIGWVKDHRIFDPNYKPRRYTFIKRQLTDKMGDDYDFGKVPVEFNTWLLFRMLVDLILVNDFVSYVLFAISWIHFPGGHSWVVHILRWSAGWLLAFFNIWVKMDAHRVVKDFAWCMNPFLCYTHQRLGGFLLPSGSIAHIWWRVWNGSSSNVCLYMPSGNHRYSVGYAFYYV
jgi:phosphatidylethanolamine N-methyltransferase